MTIKNYQSIITYQQNIISSSVSITTSRCKEEQRMDEFGCLIPKSTSIFDTNIDEDDEEIDLEHQSGCIKPSSFFNENEEMHFKYDCQSSKILYKLYQCKKKHSDFKKENKDIYYFINPITNFQVNENHKCIDIKTLEYGRYMNPIVCNSSDETILTFLYTFSGKIKFATDKLFCPVFNL